MKKKILWLLVSGLMVLSLVMAACAPAAVEEKEEEKAPVIEEKAPEQKVEEKVVAPAIEKPKYGGVLKLGWGFEISGFDDIVTRPWGNVPFHITNEHLWAGDWTKGNAGGYGTNETSWTARFDIWEHKTGYIAESWELPTKVEGETCTVTYHIRKGIHWALNPVNPRPVEVMVGGRELTTDDVFKSLNLRITDKRAEIYLRNPELRVVKINSPEPWVVTIEFPWDIYESAVSRFGDSIWITPPEVMEKYGNMNDWKNSVGTGAFILTDFVPGSTATLVRNPNYWMKDPIGPGKGNQLPYLDGVKFFIIRDTSTRYAALRTGKVDWTGGRGGQVSLEDAKVMKVLTPELQFQQVAMFKPSPQEVVAFKLDSPPFNDIRVRRAMHMAIDFEGILRDYYGGEGQILTFPITYTLEYGDAYLGLEDPDCPESVRELYSYNPEKARALLAEAGYPNGFKTNLIMVNEPARIDYFSIYKDMWSKVGVEVEFAPKEKAAFDSIKMDKTFDQMMEGVSTNTALLYRMSYYYSESGQNMAGVHDTQVDEAFAKMQIAAISDRHEANRLHRELMKHVLDQAWYLTVVTPYEYNVWWPWLKNYSGEYHVSYATTSFFAWVWLDQELKKSIGY